MKRVGVSRDTRGRCVKKSQLIGRDTIRCQIGSHYREKSFHGNNWNNAIAFYSRTDQTWSFLLKRTTRKNTKMKRGTNLDRRASFGRALPRLVPPPLLLFSSFSLRLRVKVPGWINARRIPLSFAPRKSVCSGPLPSLSVHGYLSFSRSCTATHGKWQPYCTRATLANPRTNTTVKTFGKCCVCGVLRLRTFLHRGLINDSLSDMTKYPRTTDRFARKLWKYGYRWNGSLFTTRLRVRSAVDARVSLASLLDGWYSIHSQLRHKMTESVRVFSHSSLLISSTLRINQQNSFNRYYYDILLYIKY